jgi:type II secretory pathway component PulM
MDALRELWSAREARERRLIGAGLALLALAVLWAYAWEPVVADRARLADALPRLRVQAALVAVQGGEVERLRSAARARAAAPAAEAAIAEAAKANGVGDVATAVTALAEGRVQVTMRAVPFDALVRVLAQLASSHGYAVESIALRAAPEPGRVQVETLVLRAARAN